jgi:hypothetical protein
MLERKSVSQSLLRLSCPWRRCATCSSPMMWSANGLPNCPNGNTTTLRATYERMLERGPQRFQVKPAGVPDMQSLYDTLPNFTDVLDDVKRHVALAQDSRDGLEVTPMLLLGPPGIGKTHFARQLAELLGTGMNAGIDELHDRRLAVVGCLIAVEGCQAGQGVRGPGGWRVCQPGDRAGRDRQGQFATRSMTRSERSTTCWSTTPPGALPTSSPRWPSMPARSSGSPPPTTTTRHSGTNPQPDERV